MMPRKATLLLSVLMAGCTVGPEFREPKPEMPGAFVNAGETAEESVSVAGLWKSLGNDDLNTLIDRALAENLSIARALATLEETRALSGLSFYSLLPTVGVSAEDARQSESTQDPFAFGDGGTIERFRAGFDASWEIDLFGSLRRQNDRIEFLVEADAATFHAVRVAVVAEVAQTYFQWLGESLRRDLLATNLDNQADRVDILEASLEAGRGTALDVSRARAEERRLAAGLPLAEAAVERAEQRLAVLTRTPAAELRARLAAPANMPAFPAMIATGEPRDWFLRRPDVLAAERRMAAATATVGVELAEFYPKLQLTGDFGWTGASSSAVADSDAERWRAAPVLSWRILDFGRVRQRVRAAEAALAESYAAYEESWLLALEETENALSNYRAGTEREAALEEAVSASAEASRLARLRYDAGADSYLGVLDAERTRIDLEDELAGARIDRASFLAALYKALGGDFARASD